MLRNCLWAAALFAIPAWADPIVLAAPYNVLTLNGFTDGSASIGGRLAGGGIVDIQNISVAFSDSTNEPGEYSVIGGSDLRLTGGSITGNAYDYVAGGLNSYSISGGSLTNGRTPAPPFDFAAVFADLRSRSTAMGALPDTPGDACVANGYYLECTVTQTGANVITITDSSMLTGNHGIKIINNSGDSNVSLVLNSSANGITLSGGGWDYGGVNPQHVILNFHTATTLAFGGSYYASIMAPFADMSAENYLVGFADIVLPSSLPYVLPSDGATYAVSEGTTFLNPGTGEVESLPAGIYGYGSGAGQFFFQSFVGSYSFTFAPFTGDLPLTDAGVPEPGTVLSIGCGLALLLCRRAGST